jgi:hypothetical protein
MDTVTNPTEQDNRPEGLSRAANKAKDRRMTRRCPAAGWRPIGGDLD